jgi:hypothetical protein
LWIPLFKSDRPWVIRSASKWLELCRQGETVGAHLKPVVAKDAVLVSDAAGAYGTFADENGILDIVLMTSRGEHSTKASTFET